MGQLITFPEASCPMAPTAIVPDAKDVKVNPVKEKKQKKLRGVIEWLPEPDTNVKFSTAMPLNEWKYYDIDPRLSALSNINDGKGDYWCKYENTMFLVTTPVGEMDHAQTIGIYTEDGKRDNGFEFHLRRLIGVPGPKVKPVEEAKPATAVVPNT